jgi:hypothetical protein
MKMCWSNPSFSLAFVFFGRSARIEAPRNETYKIDTRLAARDDVKIAFLKTSIV